MLDDARTSKSWSVAVSFTIQVAAIALLVVFPLIYGERLPIMTLGKAATVYLPPAPRAPAPPAHSTTRPIRAFVTERALTAPVRIPPHPVILNDAVPSIPGSELLASGPATGAPYGIGAGDLLPKPPPPEPAKPASPKPVAPPHSVRVSAGVQEAKRINYVLPQYPQLAREARISGTVQLVGVIAIDGTIQSLRVIGGHPLLVKAAVDAVRQWRYSPTLLNGQAVEVIAPITVTFTLSQ